MITKHLAMIACGLSLPALLYLALVGAGPRITEEPDRWLVAFRTVEPKAHLHSTSREIGRHYLHPQVRQVLQDGAFQETTLRSYRVAETQVQVITFPPGTPLDRLVEDGAEEYRNEDFRTRRFRVCRSNRNLLVIQTVTSGSPMGRHRVPPELIRKIMNAFRKEATQRGYSED